MYGQRRRCRSGSTIYRMTFDPSTGQLKPWWKRPWGIVVLAFAGLVLLNLVVSFVFTAMVSR